MSQSGVAFSGSKFNALLTTYFEESRRAIDQYSAISEVNGLSYSRKKELEAIETFTDSLQRANEDFNKDPMGVPSLAAWINVRSVLPNFTYRYNEAVRADND